MNRADEPGAEEADGECLHHHRRWMVAGARCGRPLHCIENALHWRSGVRGEHQHSRGRVVPAAFGVVRDRAEQGVTLSEVISMNDTLRCAAREPGWIRRPLTTIPFW